MYVSAIVCIFTMCICFCHCGPNFGTVSILNDYLTNPEEGRNATRLPNNFKGNNIESYAGYINVDLGTKSDMFFWYFKTASDRVEPLVIWLPGGPGDQVVTSIFEENGPFYVKQSRGLKERSHYWSQVVNMLYFDSPVGTGFSSTNVYVENLETVSNHLCKALKIFYTVFPEAAKSPLFIGGESWGSKQAIKFMYELHNKCVWSESRQMGLIIGNGFYDPVNMVDVSNIYLILGLLGAQDLNEYQYKEEEIRKLIGRHQFSKAFDAYDKLVKGKLWKYPTTFQNKTGLKSPESALGLGVGRSLFGNLEEYMEKDVVRRSIHVGTRAYHTDTEVVPRLRSEIMRGLVAEFGTLLSNYRVLVYHGQFNLFVPSWTASQALGKVSWCGKIYRPTATRQEWWLKDTLAGYLTRVSSPHCQGVLVEALIRDAGRYTARDQPERMLDLIDKFTHNKI